MTRLFNSPFYLNALLTGLKIEAALPQKKPYGINRGRIALAFGAALPQLIRSKKTTLWLVSHRVAYLARMSVLSLAPSLLDCDYYQNTGL